MSLSRGTDLHPETGGRFVFDRQPGTTARYTVTVYLPATRSLTCALFWDAEGLTRLDPEPSDPWVRDEALKLARVLHRDPKARMVRWRGV